MIPVKILCGCGQKYAFDIEPVEGRMPAPVQCPVCGADGTAAADSIIARALAVQGAAPGVARLRATPAPAAVAPPAPAPPSPAAAARAAVRPQQEWGPGGQGDTWKWWYYILAGVCIGGYDIWRTVETGRIKYLGGLFLSVFLVAIGVWDFQRKRKKRAGN